MGEVYRARDPRLGREVAVKLLPAELSQNPERMRRFEREARAASALTHPNIVTIHEVIDSGSGFCIVMELVPGRTLREILADGVLQTRNWLSIGIQIAEGLAKAHAAGINPGRWLGDMRSPNIEPPAVLAPGLRECHPDRRARAGW
jgi:serine/threonine protein kinase